MPYPAANSGFLCSGSRRSRLRGYVVSGKMIVRMDDGAEEELGPGDFFHIAPGHDGWVVGDEACVLVDFGGY